MADKKNPVDAVVDLDDLLDLTADDTEIVLDSAPESFDDLDLNQDEPDVPSSVPEAADLTETPEKKRIRELELALAAPIPAYDEEPVELTAEQIRIKDLEDQLAQRNALVAERAPTQYAPPASGETILLHVILDGFIAMGEVWFRGQELEFEVGGEAYKATQDRLGKSWIDLAGDVQAQYDRWGKQYIALGPFVGRRDEKFDDEVARSDARRGRAVPLIARR